MVHGFMPAIRLTWKGRPAYVGPIVMTTRSAVWMLLAILAATFILKPTMTIRGGMSPRLTTYIVLLAIVRP